MLSAGRFANTEINPSLVATQEMKAVPIAPEIQIVSPESLLESEGGVESLQAQADAVVQAEVADVHHIAQVGPEDIAVAAEEAQGIEQSAVLSEAEVRRAYEAYLAQVDGIVQADAQQSATAQHEEQKQQAAEAIEAKQDGMVAATAAEVTAVEAAKEEAAETGLALARPGEFQATSAGVGEQYAPSVAEVIAATSGSSATESSRAIPLAEDPATRQQQAAEAGDHGEKTATQQETGDAPEGSGHERPKDVPSVDKGFTNEVMSYIRARTNEAFLSPDAGVRKSGFRKLAFLLHPDKFAKLSVDLREDAEALFKKVSDLGPTNENTAQRRALYVEFQEMLSGIDGQPPEALPTEPVAEEVPSEAPVTDAPPAEASSNPAAPEAPVAPEPAAGPAAQTEMPPIPSSTAATAQEAPAVAPTTPEAPPKARSGRVEAVARKRAERLRSAKEGYDGAVLATKKQEDDIAKFKSEHTDPLNPLEAQYLHLLEMILDECQFKEEIAENQLRKIEIDNEVMKLQAEQGREADPAKRAELQDRIEDLQAEGLEVEDALLDLQKSLDKATKARELEEQSYRTARAEYDEADDDGDVPQYQGGSHRPDGISLPSQGGRAEGIQGERPKEQALGLGGATAELAKKFVAIFTDLAK